MCFGSGGGTQSTTQEFKAPEFTMQGWKDYLANTTAAAGQAAHAQYGGNRVAGLDPLSTASSGMASYLAANGTPATKGAYSAINKATAGDANPYATQSNEYMGDSPYLQKLLDSTNKDITDNYARGTAAQTDASAALHGAYGGSGWNERTAANEKALGDSLAQNTSNVRMQNYNQSAQLREAQLNRATGAYDSAAGRSLQAAGLAPGMQTSDLEAINAQNSYGTQNQAQQQKMYDDAYAKWNQQNQANLTQQDIIAQALKNASGSGGTSSSQVLNASSPWQTAAGIAGLGAGAYNAFK